MVDQFLIVFNKAINKFLALDPNSLERLQKLEGSVISIEFQPFGYLFQCVCQNHNLKLSLGNHFVADAIIRGTPANLVAVSLFKNSRYQFFKEDITIEGSAEKANALIEIFDQLEIDWEEIISHITGDVFAFRTKKALKQFRRWFNKTEHNCAQNVNDFLHEEIRLFPSKIELRDFLNDIDQLVLDVDRFENKLKYIEDNLSLREDLT